MRSDAGCQIVRTGQCHLLCGQLVACTSTRAAGAKELNSHRMNAALLCLAYHLRTHDVDEEIKVQLTQLTREECDVELDMFPWADVS